jgi:deazaflavin-dependent oxidoreductase (nitroreductase family)
MALEQSLADRSVCYLSTLGRTSGEWREVEIWFAADPDRDRIYILSGGRDRAQWVRNLRVEPSVRVRIGGNRFEGTGSEVKGGPDEGRARQLVAEKYGATRDGSLSHWARSSLPIAIDLHPA